MKNLTGLIGLWVSTAIVASASAADIGTAITYQGYLENPAGTPVNDTCDFRIGLWDAAAAGNQTGASPQTVLGVAVAAGQFTTSIDFGPAAINGTARWLEIEVQCPGDSGLTLLSPRVELKPVPHALALPSVFPDTATGNVGIGTISPGTKLDVAGDIHATGTLGVGNSVIIDGVPQGLSSALDIQVAGQRLLRLVPDPTGTDAPSVIGGYHGNEGGSFGVTVFGGGIYGLPRPNLATGIFSTISGGSGNTIDDEPWGTIGGGDSNHILTGDYSTIGGGVGNFAEAELSTIGGGGGNTAAGYASTVGGGESNAANGGRSMVGGGSNNWANGPWSMIPGGRECLALGNGSFAAGLFAEARHDGTFVWSDSNLGFASTGNNQFLIRATGGVGIGTTTPLEALHVKGNGPTLAVEGSDHAYIEYYPDGAAAGRKGYMGWAGPGSTDFTIDNEMSGGSLRLWSATGRVGVLRAPTTNALEVSGNASKTTAGDWLANSDKAIKTGVRSITGALEVISRLRPVAFRYTDDYKTGHPSIKDQDYYNYIAQEFREVFPEWVQDSGEDGLLQMDAYPASVYSVAAIQELHELVQEKDCEIETLVSEFSNLKSQISEFQSEASEIANLKSEIAELKALVANLAPKNGGGQ